MEQAQAQPQPDRVLHVLPKAQDCVAADGSPLLHPRRRHLGLGEPGRRPRDPVLRLGARNSLRVLRWGWGGARTVPGRRPRASLRGGTRVVRGGVEAKWPSQAENYSGKRKTGRVTSREHLVGGQCTVRLQGRPFSSADQGEGLPHFGSNPAVAIARYRLWAGVGAGVRHRPSFLLGAVVWRCEMYEK